MKDEQYIEHEVHIRTLNSELKSIQKNFDDKFDSMQKRLDDKFAASRAEVELIVKNLDDKLDNRFKSLWSLGILIMGLLMPVFLKSIGVL